MACSCPLLDSVVHTCWGSGVEWQNSALHWPILSRKNALAVEPARSVGERALPVRTHDAPWPHRGSGGPRIAEAKVWEKKSSSPLCHCLESMVSERGNWLLERGMV